MTVATKRPRKKLDEPRALPPNDKAEAHLRAALYSVRQAQTVLEKAERKEDAFQLCKIINSLYFHMLPRVRAVACSHCSGYRGDGEVPGMRCKHE